MTSFLSWTTRLLIVLLVGALLLDWRSLQKAKGPRINYVQNELDALLREDVVIVSSRKRLRHNESSLENENLRPLIVASNNNKTSYFFLHVGPPKTATTTLQHGLQKLNDTLWNEDDVLFDFLTTSDHYISSVCNSACHKASRTVREERDSNHSNAALVAALREIPCWDELLQTLQKQRRESGKSQMSWMYSNEDLSTGTKHNIDWRALQMILQSIDIQLVAIVTYRRFADWLHSTHRHVAKFTGRKPAWNNWPAANQEETRGLPMTLVRAALLSKGQTGQGHLFPFLYTDQVLKTIPDMIPVRLLNLHDTTHLERSPMSLLLCDLLVDTTSHACAASLAHDEQTQNAASALVLNSAAEEENVEDRPTITNYDRIAVEAYRSGKIVSTTKLTRRQIGLLARDWHHKVLNETQQDLPLSCPTPARIERVWNLVRQREEAMQQILVRNVTLKQIRQEFDRLVANPNLCIVNTRIILQNATWNALWEYLNNPATTPLTGIS